VHIVVPRLGKVAATPARKSSPWSPCCKSRRASRTNDRPTTTRR
jgi:hypothetical protein